MISQTKHLKKSFLAFNFAITKICVAVGLAEDRTRMGGIQFQVSPSYKLLIIFQKVDVYLTEPIKIDELIKLANQSIQQHARDRNGKDKNNYYF